MTVIHSLSATTPDDPNYEIQVQHWNQAHAQTITLAGNTAGASTISGTNIVFSGGPNVTLSVNAGSLVFSGGAGAAGNTGYLSDSANTASLGTVVLSNSNGFAWGLNGQTLTASYTVPNVPAQTNQTEGFYAVGNTTQNSSTTLDARTVSFGGRGIVTVGYSNGTVQISATEVPQTNQTVGLYGLGNTTQNSSTTLDARTLSFNGLGGMTVGYSNGSIQLSGAQTVAQTNQSVGLYGVGNTTQNSSTTLDARTISYGGRGDITVGFSNGTIQISGSQTNQQMTLFATSNTTQSSTGTTNASSLIFAGAGAASVGITNGSVVISVPSVAGIALYDGANSITSGTARFTNANGVSFTFNGQTISGSVAAQTNQSVGLYALGNTTQNSSTTLDARTLSFNGLGIVTMGYSNGSIQVSATQSAQTAGLYALGNTTQNSSTTLDARTMSFNALGAMTMGYSNGSIQVSAPATSSLIGINGISISTAGSTISVLPQWVSIYENLEGIAASTALTFNAASISHGVAFLLPQPISASFIRIPALMTTNSTTIATMASATASASGEIYSTWNAVFYSLGTGANSKSLQSVASGSAGFTFRNSISITNSTQYSITQGFSAQANGGGTTRTTQYSISNTNYSFTTDQIATEFSSNRMIDIPFASSLSPGAYWAVFGLSTSSASAGAAGLAALTNCNVRYSNHYGVSQADLSFGIMGSTNRTSGGLMGAASFSTAGGGTTNSIPVSAMSSIASLARVYFQLLRSA